MDEMKDRVKRRRRELELTQKQLAGRCGVKQQNIQQVESGVVRSPSYILDLAKALGVSADWLVHGAQIPQQSQAFTALWRNMAKQGDEAEDAEIEHSMDMPAGTMKEQREEPSDPGNAKGDNAFAESAEALQALTDMIQKVDPQVRDGLIEMVADYLSNPEKNRRKLFYIQSIIAAAASHGP